MNGDIQREILLMSEIDNIKGSEAIKTLSICSSVIGSDEYANEISNLLNLIFEQQNFNIFTELPHILLSIIRLNAKVTYYKNVGVDRMKYVLYGTLYNYMVKNQLNFFNQLNIGDFRLLFSNSWELIKILPQMTMLCKRGWFSCCGGDNINIK